MTGFDVTAAALSTARTDTAQARSALAAAIGDVAAEVTAVAGSSWRGTAATAFREGYDEWRRGAEQVLAALDTTAELLAVTQRGYVASDDASATTLTRLAARLGAA